MLVLSLRLCAAPADAAAVPDASAKEEPGANAIEPKDLSKVAQTVLHPPQ